MVWPGSAALIYAMSSCLSIFVHIAAVPAILCSMLMCLLLTSMSVGMRHTVRDGNLTKHPSYTAVQHDSVADMHARPIQHVIACMLHQTCVKVETSLPAEPDRPSHPSLLSSSAGPGQVGN